MSELQIQDITSLDYLVQMLEMAYRTNQMERVIHIADHLYSCTNDVYTQIQFLKAKNRTKRITINRPLVYYFGKSHLMKGLALQKLERYQESLLCIDKYQELGWFIGLDARGLEVVEDFRNFAKANRYAVSCKIDLEAGFRKSCALFESMRESATEKQVDQYKNILKGVLSNEKNYAYINCHV